MQKILIILFITVSPVMSRAQTYGENQQAIIFRMYQLKKAVIDKDSLMLDKLLAPDVNYGHTNGLVQTKAQFIRSVMSYEQDYKTITYPDMDVRIYDNTGIATAKSKVSMNYLNKPLELEMYILAVWIWKNKKWQLVARQSVKQ